MFNRFLFVIVLIIACSCTVIGFFDLFRSRLPPSKILSTASGLFALASLYQLQISGWFDQVMQRYGDTIKYPYGPPDEIVRQIIDDPDHPIAMWIRNTLFFEPGTGVYLAIVSIVISIYAAWA
jgi:hypothetical protein